MPSSSGAQTQEEIKKRGSHKSGKVSHKNEFIFALAFKMTKSNSRIRHSLNIHNFLIASRAASREWNKLW